MLTIGIVSDSHIPYRMARWPDAVLIGLAECDLILHAGDVDDPGALLPLYDIAPVHAVRGNIHLQDLSDGGSILPLAIELELMNRRFVLTHGHSPGLLGFGTKILSVAIQVLGWTDNSDLNQTIARRLVTRYPTADIIIFGHTHRAYIERIYNTLLINPGAVCPTKGEEPTMALLQLAELPRPAKVQIISLS